MSIISLKNIRYCYPESVNPAISNINLEINDGEFVLILGDNASGKSTLASVISGLIPEFSGGQLTGELKSPMKDIGYVIQDPHKQIVLDRVDLEVAYGLENMCIETKTMKNIIYQTLSFLGIGELKNKNTYELSAGQLQKVVIAQILATGKNILILDEPTSFLDPFAYEELINTLKKLNKDFGYTIILIEQNIEKSLELADRVIYLDSGNITFDDTKQKFIDDNRFYKYLPESYILANRLNIKVDIKSLRDKIRMLEIKNYKKNYKTFEQIIVNIKNLNFNYNNIKVLKDINLKIFKGEIFSLIGENGGGKTTLLKNIAGILKPNNGHVNINGRVGYLSDNPNDYLFNDTVYDELKFSLSNFKIYNHQVIMQIAEELGIKDILNKNPRDLSGGQRQKVAIASILVTRPDILLLDEPTKGLSINDKNYLKDLIIKLQNQGITIIIISHDMNFVSKVSNRIGTLFDGEMCIIDMPEKVLSSGIFYTTSISRIFKDISNEVITLDDAINYLKRE